MIAEPFYLAIGLTGAALIVFGFYRTSIGRWTSKSLWYELDTFTGAILLIIYHLHIREYISLVLEVIIALVAIRGVTSFTERYEKRKKRRLFLGKK